jgi:hypothetical protein
MKRQTIGALLLLLLVAAVAAAVKFVQPWLFERQIYKTSDAKATTKIRICGDDYLGYWMITSPDMKRQAPGRGLVPEFTDDGGNYADRLERFDRKQCDIIVLPVNSYEEHAARYKYPGVIIAGVSESKGADAILGFADRFPEGKPAELNDSSLRIVYTADSPSSFLLSLTTIDWDLFNLKAADTWKVEVDGARKVFERAQQHQGDAFVLWEPFKTMALRQIPGLKVIWGTDKFRGYVKDVFVVRRDYLQSREADVIQLFDLYFAVLRGYEQNRNHLLDDMAQTPGLRSLKREDLESMLQGIDWYDLHENAVFEFGISPNPGIPATEGIRDTIIAVTDIDLRSGRFQRDPLEGNPYTIINSGIIAALIKRAPAMVGEKGAVQRDFAELDADGWAHLEEVGILRIEPITFQTGADLLDDIGKDAVDRIAGLLVNHYPEYRVAVRGHSGQGDEDENQKLSQARAETVAQRLVAVHGLDPHRLHVEGKGSSQRPSQRPGEGMRSLRARMPRVDFVLMKDNTL